MKLILIADPMCSWCYGFSKEIALLQESHPDLPLEIRVGGVRAGDTEVMGDEMKRFRLGHWSRVEKASGLPFNREAFMALSGFAYNTEPVCRAVVATRKIAPGINQLSVFRALQRGFYADGRDTTNGAVLAELGACAIQAQGVAVSEAEFLRVWADTATVEETAADFRLVRGWGISSFPALLLEQGGERRSIAPGYTPFADLQERLAPLLGRRPVAA